MARELAPNLGWTEMVAAGDRCENKNLGWVRTKRESEAWKLYGEHLVLL